ncbi:LuxR family transcriptional regulator [Kribbella alba]|uniref:LuxR family transcriptional regulator n=1 Tax=Kribbella alba TaxID=190197 RepID=A0ABN2F1A4_9ACTN
MLHGRTGELAVLDGLLDRVRQRHSDALVIRGEAGIGKSALLAYSAERANGMRVLQAAGVESEAEFAFATLHQLLWPVRDGVDGLPGPQATAVRAAFGLAPAPTETMSGGNHRFLVAVAALTLLADAAEHQPVVCLIDDAQWVDQSSADALLFVGRRLGAEGVALVFAARDDDSASGTGFAAPELPELRLAGLDRDAAAAVLAERRSGPLPPEVVAELVGRTGGNPLALLEITLSLQPDQLVGAAPLPSALPIGARMERAFLARVRRLPESVQVLLEVIAAEDTGDLATVLRAAEALGAPGPESLDMAQEADLTRIDAGCVELRHPLMRSAVYQGMSFLQRHAVHGAIADALDPDVADRRAWHRAAACAGPDEEAAAALEQAADRARDRSGTAAAATALERAAELSTHDDARGRRLAAAAENAWLAGQARRAQALVERAAQVARSEPEQALIAHLRGQLQLRTGVPAEAVDTLVGGAALAVGHDPGRALEMLLTAADAAAYAGEPGRLIDIARRAAAVPPQRDERARFAVCYLTGLSSVFRGDMARGAELLDEADALAVTFDDPAYLLWAATTGLYTGRGDSKQLVLRAVARARELGAVGVLPYALEFAALGNAMAGRVTEAVVQASEGLRLARDTGQEPSASNLLAALATAAALRGREEDCRAYAEEALTQAVPRRLGLTVALSSRALALLDLGLGRPAEALERFTSIASAAPGAGHPFIALTCTPDLVEAAVRAGCPDVAAEVVAGFAERSRHAGPGQRGLLAYCEGLVAEEGVPDEGYAAFDEALGLFPPGAMPFWRARIELGYGERLRRERHRSRARGHLRAALETFERLGTTPWADRARTELRATGETTRRPDGTAAISELTPQELQIASFAGQGASNPAIAAQLFLSRRTVEYHLRKVFQKLGVSSRTELAALDLH